MTDLIVPATDEEIAEMRVHIERWDGVGCPEDNPDAWGMTPLIHRLLNRLDAAEKRVAELERMCRTLLDASKQQVDEHDGCVLCGRYVPDVTPDEPEMWHESDCPWPKVYHLLAEKEADDARALIEAHGGGKGDRDAPRDC